MNAPTLRGIGTVSLAIARQHKVWNVRYDQAVAGEMQPLEMYCNQLHGCPESPSILHATITVIAALRCSFGPLREELQPLLDAYLAEHQRAAQQRYEDSIRKHGRMRS